MNTAFILLNLYFSVVIWRVSKMAFNDGRITLGWTAIFFSAMNAAAAAAAMF